MIFIILSFIALLLGPLLVHFTQRRKATLQFIDMFVLCSIFGLIALHVLPESIEEAGVTAILAALVGLFGPMLLSFGFKKEADCHLHPSILSLATLGVLAHAILDGATLSTMSNEHGEEAFFLGVAVLLHRLPEGVAIWRITQSFAGGKMAAIALAADIAATSLGFFSGTSLLTYASEQMLVVFQALMSGVLLHVMFHRHHLLPEDHDHHHHHDGYKIPTLRKATFWGVFCAVALVLTLSLLHISHTHIH